MILRCLQLFNQKLETNDEQVQAVKNILNRSSHPAPYLIYGAPGTGKSDAIVETICQVSLKSPLTAIELSLLMLWNRRFGREIEPAEF